MQYAETIRLRQAKFQPMGILRKSYWWGSGGPGAWVKLVVRSWEWRCNSSPYGVWGYACRKFFEKINVEIAHFVQL